MKEERPCLWEAVPEGGSGSGSTSGVCRMPCSVPTHRGPEAAAGVPPPCSAGDCAFATVQHQHSCFSHPFTTGPNGVLVRSGEKPRGGPGPLPADHQVKEDANGRGGGPRPPEWSCYLCLLHRLLEGEKKKKKLCIILPHMLAAVYIPCQCLSTGELFAIRWGKGREAMKSAKENMFLKAQVLYNRMFSSRCLLF